MYGLGCRQITVHERDILCLCPELQRDGGNKNQNKVQMIAQIIRHDDMEHAIVMWAYENRYLTR